MQSDYGIKPYTAFLGALRVRDAVEIAADVGLSDPRPGGRLMTSGYDPQAAARLAAAGDDARKAFARRIEPMARLAGQADAVTEACHAMAVRFHQGGKLVVFGTGAAAPTHSMSRWSSCIR